LANVAAGGWAQHGHHLRRKGERPADFARWYFLSDADAEAIKRRCNVVAPKLHVDPITLKTSPASQAGLFLCIRRPLPFRRRPCFDPPMARTSTRNVNPSLSSDPRDKLLAALNWFYGNLKHSDPYDRAPMYCDACLAWHEALSAG
jgi:hypothetical protein